MYPFYENMIKIDDLRKINPLIAALQEKKFLTVTFLLPVKQKCLRFSLNTGKIIL